MQGLDSRKNLEGKKQHEWQQEHIGIESKIGDLLPTHRAEIARTTLQKARGGTTLVEPSSKGRCPRHAQRAQQIKPPKLNTAHIGVRRGKLCVKHDPGDPDADDRAPHEGCNHREVIDRSTRSVTTATAARHQLPP